MTDLYYQMNNIIVIKLELRIEENFLNETLEHCEHYGHFL